MKVAVVMPLAEQRGGAEMALLHLLQQGHGLGIEWLVIFLADGPMVTQAQSLGIPTHVTPAGRLRQPVQVVKTIAAIGHILRMEKVDAVISWMTKPHLYAGPAAFFAGISACWYQHGMPSRNSWLDKVATWIPASGILACSRAGSNAQRQFKPSRPIQTVYPGVELDRFDPERLPTSEEARHNLGLPRTGPLIGIVGRLQRWKGIHVLIEAMPQIREKYPDTHCVIVGGTHDLELDYPEYLKSLIEKNGLQETVILAGFQTNVQDWMQAMDVFVHASDNEPFGIVIIEAMALGKPVIAGSQGGPTEIITDGKNGLLTPYGDANLLAQAILQYLDNPIFAAQVGKAAQRRAADFSTQHYAQNVVAAVQNFCTPVKLISRNELKKA